MGTSRRYAYSVCVNNCSLSLTVLPLSSGWRHFFQVCMKESAFPIACKCGLNIISHAHDIVIHDDAPSTQFMLLRTGTASGGVESECRMEMWQWALCSATEWSCQQTHVKEQSRNSAWRNSIPTLKTRMFRYAVIVLLMQQDLCTHIKYRFVQKNCGWAPSVQQMIVSFTIRFMLNRMFTPATLRPQAVFDQGRQLYESIKPQLVCMLEKMRVVISKVFGGLQRMWAGKYL